MKTNSFESRRVGDQIEPGDLIWLAKSCCSHSSKYLGWIAQVEARSTSTYQCSVCGHEEAGEHVVVTFTGRGPLPVHWLRRIPPLNELERDAQTSKVSA